LQITTSLGPTTSFPTPIRLEQLQAPIGAIGRCNAAAAAGCSVQIRSLTWPTTWLRQIRCLPRRKEADFQRLPWLGLRRPSRLPEPLRLQERRSEQRRRHGGLDLRRGPQVQSPCSSSRQLPAAFPVPGRRRHHRAGQGRLQRIHGPRYRQRVPMIYRAARPRPTGASGARESLRRPIFNYTCRSQRPRFCGPSFCQASLEASAPKSKWNDGSLQPRRHGCDPK
jgi:hypothetical protein